MTSTYNGMVGRLVPSIVFVASTQDHLMLDVSVRSVNSESQIY